MNKAIATGIVSALICSSFTANAGPIKMQLEMTTVKYIYDPAQYYNNIGTETPLGQVDPDGVGGTELVYATLRDEVLNDGGEGPNGLPGDGRGDATFGDITYGTRINRIIVSDDSSGIFEEILVYDTQPLYLDFRFVLEEGTFITNDLGVSQYDLIEEYSFFDILTQDEDDPLFDWGLGLDTDFEKDAKLNVDINDDGSVISISNISGTIFNDANNLPFAFVDPFSPIDIELSFQLGAGTVFADPTANGFVAGDGQIFNTGSTSVIFTVPEPGTLGILGLSLAGLGFMQRRRRLQTQNS